eukprot:gnl/Chilomastix_cuspidata/2857.p1 GENE.gnl/Chilomastix_cuspidata/2857~~gnl/Chilomastix_cuspidata/2857.p1  ORF type:complete len:410 (+),score=158.82 gnl/Chilomastix_cuspidata/2857:110-1339(+)
MFTQTVNCPDVTDWAETAQDISAMEFLKYLDLQGISDDSFAYVKYIVVENSDTIEQLFLEGDLDAQSSLELAKIVAGIPNLTSLTVFVPGFLPPFCAAMGGRALHHLCAEPETEEDLRAVDALAATHMDFWTAEALGRACTSTGAAPEMATLIIDEPQRAADFAKAALRRRPLKRVNLVGDAEAARTFLRAVQEARGDIHRLGLSLPTVDGGLAVLVNGLGLTHLSLGSLPLEELLPFISAAAAPSLRALELRIPEGAEQRDLEALGCAVASLPIRTLTVDFEAADFEAAAPFLVGLQDSRFLHSLRIGGFDYLGKASVTRLEKVLPENLRTLRLCHFYRWDGLIDFLSCDTPSHLAAVWSLVGGSKLMKACVRKGIQVLVLGEVLKAGKPCPWSSLDEEVAADKCCVM